MNELGIKIASIRKAKGLSQEKLSEEASINLRTLQRIEKGETNPHGDTLRRIADALGIPIEELMSYGALQNLGYIKAMHFSVLTFIVLPLGNIILPLIMWLVRKNNVQNLSFFAKNLLNFQITWTIIACIPYYWWIVNFFFKPNVSIQFHLITPWTFLILFFGFMFLINIIYTFIVGISVSDKLKNWYPVAIRFIR